MASNLQTRLQQCTNGTRLLLTDLAVTNQRALRQLRNQGGVVSACITLATDLSAVEQSGLPLSICYLDNVMTAQTAFRKGFLGEAINGHMNFLLNGFTDLELLKDALDDHTHSRERIQVLLPSAECPARGVLPGAFDAILDHIVGNDSVKPIFKVVGVHWGVVSDDSQLSALEQELVLLQGRLTGTHHNVSDVVVGSELQLTLPTMARFNRVVRTPVSDLLCTAAAVVDKVVGVNAAQHEYIVCQGVPPSPNMQVALLGDTESHCAYCTDTQPSPDIPSTVEKGLDIEDSAGEEDFVVQEESTQKSSEEHWRFVSYANQLQTVIELPTQFPIVEPASYVTFVPHNAQLANLQWHPIESRPTSFFIMDKN